ncbi:MAG: SPOR domain-containing protein [Schleiferiaceae bacterium]|nr:SPOR domain-containing protein [Schleiferiaceae bacterium]
MKKQFTLSLATLATALCMAQETSRVLSNDTNNTAGHLALDEPAAVNQLVSDFLQENANAKTLKGYRVQLFNGSKAEAQKVRIAFLKAYPDIDIVMTYQTPEYKIQAGNFRTRIEAEQLLNELRSTFKGSFVVKSTIDFPPLQELSTE